MKLPPPLHDWHVTPRQAIALQRELSARVISDEGLPVRRNALVAGCDVSYSRRSTRLFAGVAVVQLPDLRLVEQRTADCEVAFPYVPGLLSFREVPPLLAALAQVECEPDLLMLDGQGLAHPRRFGLACHLGVWLECPTLGCAKSLLVGEVGALAEIAGSTAPLTEKGDVVGMAVRTRPRVKPIYVSCGHRITLADAVAWTQACVGKYRIPEPTRRAHLIVNQARRAAVGTEPAT
jgi:deoxyribonuclease V